MKTLLFLILFCHAASAVSLLQKSPSSPVSCHATGFYPDRATMFWRKDGEEIHEGVDHGEILPNHDRTFQMNVDLDISSVRAEDWSRYDCVFHLSGVQDAVITRVDDGGIRTNWEALDEPESKPSWQSYNAFRYLKIGAALLVLFSLICGCSLHKTNDVFLNGGGTAPGSKVFPGHRTTRHLKEAFHRIAGEFDGYLLGDSGYPCQRHLLDIVCHNHF